MQRLLIQIINFSLLFIILVGIPAATRAQVGSWQISSATNVRLVIFWGLGIAAGLNAVGALFFIKSQKDRKLCWEWTAIFGGLWLAYFGFVRGWFDFEWLKHSLQWLQKRF